MRSMSSKTILFVALVVVAAMLALPSVGFAEETVVTLTPGTQSSESDSEEAVEKPQPSANVTKATVDTSKATVDGTKASVLYSAHSQSGSWQAWKQDGADAGEGASLDLLKVKLASNVKGAVQYQAYVKGVGWQQAKSGGASIGKLGSKYGIEALRVALTGEVSKSYSVYYSVKKRGGSWQAWKSNGSVAGRADSGEPIVGFKVKLVKRKSAADSGAGLVGIRYRVRAQSGKWQQWLANNAKASGKSRIRGLAVSLDTGAYSGSVYYRVRMTNGRWKPWKKNGAASERGSRIEAIQIKLKGSIASRYDVVYRAYIQGVGWQRRAFNGDTAGVIGQGKNIRAVRIKVVEKTKRTGWVGSGNTWRYYSEGNQVKGQWVETKESPIETTVGSRSGVRRYWIDATGVLAVDRLINPSKKRDKAAGHMAYATISGYIMVDETRMIAGKWYTANSQGVLTRERGKRAIHIARYVQWAINIANDNRHGYSQAVRWGPDYDCSSLVVAALKNTGFQVGDAVYTGNMRSELTKYGFRWYTDFSNLKRGDILLVHNNSRQHTEIYLGEGRTVGAHIAETGGIYGVAGDQTGNEISIGPYYSIWEGYLRYVG